MCACCAAAQDRFHSKASQLWPRGAFPEGSSKSVEQRRYRLGARTPDSQSGNPGSIPGTATNFSLVYSLSWLSSTLVRSSESGINDSSSRCFFRFLLARRLAGLGARQDGSGSFAAEKRVEPEGNPCQVTLVSRPRIRGQWPRKRGGFQFF